MADTTIEWTDTTWNPTTGCDRVSPGCDNCYALTLAKRLKAMGSEKYQNDGDPITSGPGFAATAHEDALDAPLRWRKPRRVFVNSMSDLFHKAFTDEFIAKVFAVMAMTQQHTYQVLTKRHGRMRALLSDPDGEFQGMVGAARYDLGDTDTNVPTPELPSWGWPLPNVWLGVSVENQKWADTRIPALLMTPATVRFLSCEPLLGPVDLTRVAYTDGGGTHLDVVNGRHGVPDLWTTAAKRVDWVIAGGESGPRARPMPPHWARSLRDQCHKANVPFFFKQHGEWAPTGQLGIGNTDPREYLVGEPVDEMGHREVIRRVGKHEAGRILDGRTHNEFPAVAL